jgi:uncharacterized membrane-anchored protein
MLLLVISGAISSGLLSSGHFVPSLILMGLTAAALFYFERKEQKSRQILKDKPIY